MNGEHRPNSYIEIWDQEVCARVCVEEMHVSTKRTLLESTCNPRVSIRSLNGRGCPSFVCCCVVVILRGEGGPGSAKGVRALIVPCAAGIMRLYGR